GVGVNVSVSVGTSVKVQVGLGVSVGTSVGVSVSVGVSLGVKVGVGVGSSAPFVPGAIVTALTSWGGSFVSAAGTHALTISTSMTSTANFANRSKFTVSLASAPPSRIVATAQIAKSRRVARLW